MGLSKKHLKLAKAIRRAGAESAFETGHSSNLDPMNRCECPACHMQLSVTQAVVAYLDDTDGLTEVDQNGKYDFMITSYWGYPFDDPGSERSWSDDD